jgi:hypothetical protein
MHGKPQTTVEVQVNLEATTLAGIAENPSELAGYGPIPAEMARDLAAARRWRAASSRTTKLRSPSFTGAHETLLRPARFSYCCPSA